MPDVRVTRELVERVRAKVPKHIMDGSPLHDIAALVALAEAVLDAEERKAFDEALWHLRQGKRSNATRIVAIQRLLGKEERPGE